MKLIIDVESTCWEKRQRDSEIIEIGAVLFDTDYIPLDYIIKPIQYTELSEFCIKLTSITQQMVDDGISFVEAISKLANHAPIDEMIYWGCYDYRVLMQDCERHKIHFPFPHNHLNLKMMFADKFNNCKGVGEEKALEILGLQFEGTRHRGIDDAYNIYRIYKSMREKGLIF